MNRIRRTGARMVLLDDRDRVLLIEERWQHDGVLRHHWITPGGGIEAGEDLAAAATREVYEETALRVELPTDAAEIHVQRRDWEWAGLAYDQDDHFFGARLGGPAESLHPAAPTEMEIETVIGERWWTVEELRASPDVFEPPEIAELVVGLRGADLPRPMLRTGGRTILLDPAGRTLLIAFAADEGVVNWVTPGGGAEAEETAAAAAVRELREETGLTIAGVSGAPVHVERAVFCSFGRWFDQRDEYFVVPVPADPVIAPAGLTDDEAVTVSHYEWFDAAGIRSLEASTDPVQHVWPLGLADIVERLTTGRAPG